jgi:phosphotransferase system IIB component
MLRTIQNAFWKALTPDLIPDQDDKRAIPPPELSKETIAALGGKKNLASQQRVALTRIRIQLRESDSLDEARLRASGIRGVMMLNDGVIHVLLGHG